MPVRTSRTGTTHPQYDTASSGHLRWAVPPLTPRTMHVNPPHETATAGSDLAEPEVPPTSGESGRRRMWRRVLLLWSLSRLVTVGVGLLVTSQLAWHRHIESWQTQPWQALTGWDSVYYIDISHVGYLPGSSSVAFFPLYPLLISIVRVVPEAGDAIAALSVSALTLLAAMVGLYTLGKERLSEEIAWRAVVYLMLSPFAFVFSLAYTEGLFLALAVWIFVFVDRDRPASAAALALLAGLSRVTGLALVLPLAYIAYRRRSVPWAIAAAMPAVGFGMFAALLHRDVGDALAMIHVQSEWGGHPSVPPMALVSELVDFVSDHQPIHLLSVLAVFIYLGLLVPILRRPIFARHRVEDTLYVGCVFAMPLFAGVLQSSGRFGLVAFPLFFALADLGMRHRTMHQVYVVFAPVAQVLLFAYVALGYLVP